MKPGLIDCLTPDIEVCPAGKAFRSAILVRVGKCGHCREGDLETAIGEIDALEHRGLCCFGASRQADPRYRIAILKIDEIDVVTVIGVRAVYRGKNRTVGLQHEKPSILREREVMHRRCLGNLEDILEKVCLHRAIRLQHGKIRSSRIATDCHQRHDTLGMATPGNSHLQDIRIRWLATQRSAHPLVETCLLIGRGTQVITPYREMVACVSGFAVGGTHPDASAVAGKRERFEDGEG